MAKPGVLAQFSNNSSSYIPKPSKNQESFIKVQNSASVIKPTSETYLTNDLSARYIEKSSGSYLAKSDPTKSYILDSNPGKSYIAKQNPRESYLSNDRTNYLLPTKSKDSYITKTSGSVLGARTPKGGPPSPPMEAFMRIPDRPRAAPPSPPREAFGRSAFLIEESDEEEDQHVRFNDYKSDEKAWDPDFELFGSGGGGGGGASAVDAKLSEEDLRAVLDVMGGYTRQEIDAAVKHKAKDIVSAINHIVNIRMKKKKRMEQLERAVARKRIAAQSSPKFAPPHVPQAALPAPQRLRAAKKPKKQNNQMDEMKKQLVDMGFPRYKVEQATKRYKTVAECLDFLASADSESKDNSRASRASSAVYDKRLPRGWDMRYDQKGKRYYSNHETRQTQWTDPRPLPDGWTKHKDKRTGRFYFKSAKLRTTNWDDPRGAIEPGNRP